MSRIVGDTDTSLKGTNTFANLMDDSPFRFKNTFSGLFAGCRYDICLLPLHYKIKFLHNQFWNIARVDL
jgi:hypothetical protein